MANRHAAPSRWKLLSIVGAIAPLATVGCAGPFSMGPDSPAGPQADPQLQQPAAPQYASPQGLPGYGPNPYGQPMHPGMQQPMHPGMQQPMHPGMQPGHPGMQGMQPGHPGMMNPGRPAASNPRLIALGQLLAGAMELKVPLEPSHEVTTASSTARGVKYNPAFMQHLEQRFGESAVAGVLGHELGHIKRGHVSIPKGSSPNWLHARELEADEESGCALAKLKINPAGYIRATVTLAGHGSHSHPAGLRRRAAIVRGFKTCTAGQELVRKPIAPDAVAAAPGMMMPPGMMQHPGHPAHPGLPAGPALAPPMRSGGYGPPPARLDAPPPIPSDEDSYLQYR